VLARRRRQRASLTRHSEGTSSVSSRAAQKNDTIKAVPQDITSRKDSPSLPDQKEPTTTTSTAKAVVEANNESGTCPADIHELKSLSPSSVSDDHSDSSVSPIDEDADENDHDESEVHALHRLTSTSMQSLISVYHEVDQGDHILSHINQKAPHFQVYTHTHTHTHTRIHIHTRILLDDHSHHVLFLFFQHLHEGV
jgi:hypothetical protein